MSKNIKATNFFAAVFGTKAKPVGEKDFAAFLKAVEGTKLRHSKGSGYIAINPAHGIREKIYWVPNLSEDAGDHPKDKRSKHGGRGSVHLVHPKNGYYSTTVLQVIIKSYLIRRGYDQLYAEW